MKDNKTRHKERTSEASAEVQPTDTPAMLPAVCKAAMLRAPTYLVINYLTELGTFGVFEYFQ